MKQWYQIVFGVLIGLLAAGGILLLSKPNHGIPIELSPAPSPTYTQYPKPTSTSVPMQVQIGGQVTNPGIYAIQPKTRLEDLISLAGGLTHRADKNRITYAALLHDGDYFYIPAVDEIIPETARNAPSNSGPEITQFTYPLNLNSTSLEALESLPGIGPEKAADILEYREYHGPFLSVDDLLNVTGIGQKTLETLREYLIVEP